MRLGTLDQIVGHWCPRLAIPGSPKLGQNLSMPLFYNHTDSPLSEAVRILVRSGLFKLTIVLVGFALLLLPAAKRYRIYRLPFGQNQLRREILPALMMVCLDTVLIVGFRILFLHRMVPASLSSVLITFVWMAGMYEVWFYVTHRLLHHPKLYFLHAQHHVAHVTEPLTSLSFSIIERLILIGGALGLLLLGSFFLPITQAGGALFILFNYTFNVYGHSNVEWMPEWFVRSPLGRVFFTATFHAMHHARYGGHYGLFTVLLDRAFGTTFPDYPQVHARARQGLGLTRLGEKVTSDVATNGAV